MDQLLSASFEDIAAEAAPAPQKAKKSGKATASVRPGLHKPEKEILGSKRPAHTAASGTSEKSVSRKRSKAAKDQGVKLR